MATKHDVFISFRSTDTGTNFTSHLRAAFTRNCIDATSGGGEGFTETIVEKISECLVSVVVFSENYAHSPYCLNELVKIIESKDKMGQTVLPVFLGVEPTHVRKQTGAFGDGFNMLIKDQNFKDKEETWRHALVDTANLSGWDSKEKSQDKIVEGIVNRVEKILDQLSINDQYDGFVGISRVEKVETLIGIGSSERVRSIGIWGMGGIGKTSIAKLVFHRQSNRFDGACFVGNVRAKVDMKGLDSVQKDMILQLLGEESSSIRLHMFSPTVQRKLKRKKLLVVVDDVDTVRQLKALLGRDDSYYPGSRIIVTSRDKQVLINGCTEVYEVERLNRREALLLFRIHAFKQDHLPKKLIDLSKKAISYAKGLPLALEVLGCNLCGRDVEEWETELSKLEEIPDIEITDILRISYDGLDEKEKNIFLDIACIFQGWTRERIESILDGCGFFAAIGLSCLFHKALITIVNGILWMHDLVQQLGQDIVFRECIEEPGRRSRLWRWKDISNVLTTNTGTKKIEVITLDLSKASNMQLKHEVFKQMPRLRVLNVHQSWSVDIKILLPNGLNCLPDGLRYFRWDLYPLPQLPRKFNPEYLVEFHMRKSHLKQLWSGEVELCLPNLKHIDLSFSDHLTRFPNFRKTLNLERLDISYCKNLEEFPSSIQHLVKLEYIRSDFNSSLERFPDCSRLTKLETIHLSGCTKMINFPDIPPNITFLELSGTAIQELPSSSFCHSRLRDLLLRECKELKSLPSNIGDLKHLKVLDVTGCSKLASIPESLGMLESLKQLNLDRIAGESLPDSICNLGSLQTLSLRFCLNLTTLPDNLGNLRSLQKLYTDGSPLQSLPSSIYRLSLLTELSCPGYKGDALPSFIGFSHQNNDCGDLDIIGLVSLEELNLQRSDLKSLPESIKYLPVLKWLHLSHCEHLTAIPELPSSLKFLDASNCTSIRQYTHSLLGEDDQRFPEYFEFDFANCSNLEGDPMNKITIMSDLWLRIQTMATTGYKARICIPGSEVPEWFKYSGIGSSLQVETSCKRRLDSHRLIFCAVVAVAPNVDPRNFAILCKCLTETGEEYISSCKYGFYNDNEVILRSEHIILWYDDVQEFETSPCLFIEATFEFFVVDVFGGALNVYEIVKCGVTPVQET